MLDAEEQIEISRRGFPIVPNFSTTIDGATGRTLDSAIADLGDVRVLPSFTRARKGYIALSRVKKAHDLFLAQPFSPALFSLGLHEALVQAKLCVCIIFLLFFWAARGGIGYASAQQNKAQSFPNKLCAEGFLLLI